MRLLNLGSLLASSVAVAAFQDTSPFFFFSTVDIPQESLQVSQITSSSSLLESLKQQLSPCNADTYFIIHQPGVKSSDFAAASASPKLRSFLDTTNEESHTKASYNVSEVIGELDPSELQRYLGEECKADVTTLDGPSGHFEMALDINPKVMRFDFPTLPVSNADRIGQLVHTDKFLSSFIKTLPLSSKHIVMYTTTSGPSSEGHLYQHSTSNEQQKLGLNRRGLDARQGENVTLVDGPLFERFQFLTPAIFMGLIVVSILLMILYVAISAVSSLQVSYAAFDKEMGPTAQKKQQ
ncbi:MAG: hypothetical protein M4579_004807 [Chaenotheca gracillima]|nr:MAG: hypothetical protein M4579_004807 [Chaenotheca gracillima]